MSDDSIRAVLIDVDGTLVLSNDAHARSWVQAFREHGYNVPFERVRPLMGMGGDRLLPAVVPGLSDEQGVGKEIAQRRKQIFLTEHLHTVTATPGARALVERLLDDGLQLVVSTSAKEDELQALLKVACVDDLLKVATTSSEADSSKPSPDVVNASLEKLSVLPEQAVMLGDTPYDIEAASKAGVTTLAVRCGGFDHKDLAGAAAIYDDPADLLAHYDVSLLGQGAVRARADDSRV